MTEQTFVYVTYIRTTPDQLWRALTEAEFMKQYWFGFHAECDWKAGSPWKLVSDDGNLTDAGEVLESAPGRRLVLKWRNEMREELKAEGFSRATFEIEPAGETVKLTVIHEAPGTKFLTAVSGGWPKILASLKTLLETGEALQRPAA